MATLPLLFARVRLAEAAAQAEVGFLGRLAGLFSPFDNPDKIEIILPSTVDKSDADTSAPASSDDADADAKAESEAAADPDAREGEDSSRLEIFYEPPGQVDENAPVSVQP